MMMNDVIIADRRQPSSDRSTLQSFASVAASTWTSMTDWTGWMLGFQHCRLVFESYFNRFRYVSKKKRKKERKKERKERERKREKSTPAEDAKQSGDDLMIIEEDATDRTIQSDPSKKKSNGQTRISPHIRRRRRAESFQLSNVSVKFWFIAFVNLGWKPSIYPSCLLSDEMGMKSVKINNRHDIEPHGYNRQGISQWICLLANNRHRLPIQYSVSNLEDAAPDWNSRSLCHTNSYTILLLSPTKQHWFVPHSSEFRASSLTPNSCFSFKAQQSIV